MLKIIKKPHTLNNKLRSDVRPTMLSNMLPMCYVKALLHNGDQLQISNYVDMFPIRSVDSNSQALVAYKSKLVGGAWCILKIFPYMITVLKW